MANEKETISTFCQELQQLLDKYDFELEIDFDRRGACGPIEAVLVAQTKSFDCEYMSVNLSKEGIVNTPLIP